MSLFEWLCVCVNRLEHGNMTGLHRETEGDIEQSAMASSDWLIQTHFTMSVCHVPHLTLSMQLLFDPEATTSFSVTLTHLLCNFHTPVLYEGLSTSLPYCIRERPALQTDRRITIQRYNLLTHTHGWQTANQLTIGENKRRSEKNPRWMT